MYASLRVSEPGIGGAGGFRDEPLFSDWSVPPRVTEPRMGGAEGARDEPGPHPAGPQPGGGAAAPETARRGAPETGGE